MEVPLGMGVKRDNPYRGLQGPTGGLATVRWCHTEEWTGRWNRMPSSKILTRSETKASGV